MSLRNMSFYGLALLAGALTVMAVAACKAVPLTAPNNSTLTIQANPLSIPIIGGASTITATVFKAAFDGGGTVADGTQIFFTTDLGVIEERVATTNGIARATLKSDGRGGVATVTASSGSIESEPVVVEIGWTGDRFITVVANPSTLGPTDVTSEIVATVTDSRGNLLYGERVIFSTNYGVMASQGSVLRTNTNGQAFDRLTLVDDWIIQVVTVTVTSGKDKGFVLVSRGLFFPPIMDFVAPSSGTKGSSLTVTIGGQNFQPGTTVSFGVGIGIDGITFVNAQTLSVKITIDPNTTSGPRDVIVRNPDLGFSTFYAAFRIFD